MVVVVVAVLVVVVVGYSHVPIGEDPSEPQQMLG